MRLDTWRACASLGPNTVALQIHSQYSGNRNLANNQIERIDMGALAHLSQLRSLYVMFRQRTNECIDPVNCL